MMHSKRATNPRAARARRERRRRRLRQWLLALVAASGLVGLFLYVSLGEKVSDLVAGGSTDQPRAAIVDQLSLTDPSASFVEAARSTLAQAGHSVDYYPGQEVTVEFYRKLPRYDYDLVVLRVHSGLVREILGGSSHNRVTNAVALMTGEVYDRAKHGRLAEAGRMGVGLYEGTPPFLGIAPTFVRATMEGRFRNTTIILMGCDGLFSDETARAFLDRGASAFVGWSGPVSATHTDAATERFLQHLLIDDLGTREAAEKTIAEVGLDPEYGSTLLVRTSEG